ncbi:purine-nucleoside phosphorylase [Geoalkalibacter subterraneus]|uniref:purine-nucleoside phosphorylase n=1 Tax=Geoalkalibacter subterraneus TaxID=483547 RepID=UPI000693F4B2|nr:purine-nucleoside phosphorylase [Geoalkalibacter subterraneus]
MSLENKHSSLAAAFVQERFALRAGSVFDLAVVLGSGWGGLVDRLVDAQSIPYCEIPGFGAASVAGHRSRLWAGTFNGWRLLVFQGRYHLYEGYRACEVVRPVELAADLGCPRLLLTNAAGGVPAHFRPGDFLFIEDHLNLTGDNPLRGLSDAFIDLSRLYRKDLYPALNQRLKSRGIRMHQGVLASLPGPSYETPAEVRMIEMLGGHAVSMSTVPEAIMACYRGLDVVALSLISNHAAGVADVLLSHEDVLAAGSEAAGLCSELVGSLIDCWGSADEGAPAERQ